MPDALKFAIEDIYKKFDWKVSVIAIEKESTEYGACRFNLEDKQVVFRTGKVTPTKIGLFVTLWKRPHPDSKPVPLDVNDGIDFLVVDASDAHKRGQFVFAQEILVEKGIMSSNGKKGKTAFRLYPAWSKPIAKDAIKTQIWQRKYFFQIVDGEIDRERVKKLFSLADV